MNFIDQIILVNFQSHIYSELSLSKGVNVIVGPSDSGKTAVMRALRWNLFNEPSGVDFIREGETDVSVTVRFQNHVEVERRRSRSKNQYILRRPEEEELIFEGFGTNVPQEIEEATGIKKVMLDDKKSLALNFSDQLEGPFLLQETDAYKAQAIGRMVGVDLLDETMRDTLRDKKQIAMRREIMEKDLEETEKSLDAFSDLDDKIALREKVGAILAAVERLREKEQAARAFLDRTKEIKANRAFTEAILKRYCTVKNLQERLDHLHHTIARYQNERLLFDLFVQNAHHRKETGNLLSAYENLHVLEQNITRLTTLKNTYDEIAPVFNRRQSIRAACQQNQALLEKTKGVFTVSAMELNEKYGILSDYRHSFQALQELRQRIKQGTKFLARFNQLDAFSGVNKHLMEIMEKERSMQSLLDVQKKLDLEKKKLSSDLKTFIDEDQLAMNAYLDSLAHAGTCPLCKQPIDDEALHAIKHNLED